MIHEVSQNQIGGWNVEVFDKDGIGYVAQFSGPFAELRAREYAAWMNKRIEEMKLFLGRELAELDRESK